MSTASQVPLRANKIDNRDWIKESKSDRFLRGITRFFKKSKYSWGWIDDLNLKWCETASNWVIHVERMSKEQISPEYFEDEYRRLYDEVYWNHPSITNLHQSEEAIKHNEQRRKNIDQNKSQIIKDLNRTFTKSKEFGEGTEGRIQLMNVLEVLSLKYMGIGYVQGMNFIVAGILYHASPQVTLGLMSHLLEDYQLWDIFSENLVGVHYHNGVLVKLFEKHIPRLYEHFKEHEINLEIFTTQWVIDLFSHIIPLWDYKLFLDR